MPRVKLRGWGRGCFSTPPPWQWCTTPEISFQATLSFTIIFIFIFHCTMYTAVVYKQALDHGENAGMHNSFVSL